MHGNNIKKRLHGANHYHLVAKNIDEWMTISELMNKYKDDCDLTKKQLYDRLNRLSNGADTAVDTVYKCVTIKMGSIVGRKGKKSLKFFTASSHNLWPVPESLKKKVKK